MGHRDGESGAQWPESHAPSLAVVNGIPYVAWYEAGGYGWGKEGDSAVFVGRRQAHPRVPGPGSGPTGRAPNTPPPRPGRGAAPRGTPAGMWPGRVAHSVLQGA